MAMSKWFYPYLDEATGGDEGGAGGGSAAPGAAQGEQKTTPVDIAAGMLAAIEAGHTGADPNAGASQDDKGGASGIVTVPVVRDEAGRFTKAAPGAAPAAQPGEQPAAGAKIGPDGKPLAPTQGEQPKAKKADDFTLTEDDKKALKPASQQRFHELHRFAKDKEADADRLAQENAALAEARDNIMTVLTDNKVEPEDFVMFVDFNRKVKTGDLEGALNVVDNYRVQLLQALGRDAPGYDPLALQEHADLKARVDAQQLSREDALELVKARRIHAAAEQQGQHQQQTQRQQNEIKQAQESALTQVQRWNASLAGDVDYAAKAGTILPQLEGIIATYPPHLWVPTLDRLYKALVVTPPQQQQHGQQGQQGTSPAPLRPSGAKGGPAAPNNMLEALEQGLGYQGK